MISTVTTTTTTVTTSSTILWILIVILPSFLYHYVKTKEYKGTVVGSIIIGAIFGFIYGIIAILSSSWGEVPFGALIIISLIMIMANCIASIILALLGGLIAVKLKEKNSKVE
ncbi:MAG TPA: hypothetical protein VK426_06000 [Methanobacterium sp.]|nr:hypothetical protein [Methanobacterium sp.]